MIETEKYNSTKNIYIYTGTVPVEKIIDAFITYSNQKLKIWHNKTKTVKIFAK